MTPEEIAREIVVQWSSHPSIAYSDLIERFAAALAASEQRAIDTTGYIQCARCGQGSRNQTVIQDDKTSDRWLCTRCVMKERDDLRVQLQASEQRVRELEDAARMLLAEFKGDVTGEYSSPASREFQRLLEP